MNQLVDQQMSSCVHAKELAIDHVRNPRERMPVRRIPRGERPDESRAGKTPIHHWIFLDIRGVIESDELMPDHLRVNSKRHYRQTEQDEKIRSPASCNLAKRHSGASARRSEARSFSRSRCSFGHALCEITRA